MARRGEGRAAGRTMRARNGEHLLFPAGKRAAALFHALRENRKIVEDAVGYLRLRGRPAARVPIRRFSRTVSLAKMPRPCGTKATPFCATRCGGRPQIDAPSSSMLPLLGRSRPMIVRISVVLPAPFRPRRASTSPATQLQADSAEDRVDP